MNVKSASNFSKASIVESEDFDRFIVGDLNRAVSMPHVMRVADSINERGYRMDQPILAVKAGEKFKIIDGQHRFLACRQLQRPFYFQLIPRRCL